MPSNATTKWQSPCKLVQVQAAAASGAVTVVTLSLLAGRQIYCCLHGEPAMWPHSNVTCRPLCMLVAAWLHAKDGPCFVHIKAEGYVSPATGTTRSPQNQYLAIVRHSKRQRWVWGDCVNSTPSLATVMCAQACAGADGSIATGTQSGPWDQLQRHELSSHLCRHQWRKLLHMGQPDG